MSDIVVTNDALLPAQVERRRARTPEQRLALAVLEDAVAIATGARRALGHAYAQLDASRLGARIGKLDAASKRRAIATLRRERGEAARRECLVFLASSWGAFWFSVARVDHDGFREWAERELGEAPMAPQRGRAAS